MNNFDFKIVNERLRVTVNSYFCFINIANDFMPSRYGLSMHSRRNSCAFTAKRCATTDQVSDVSEIRRGISARVEHVLTGVSLKDKSEIAI